MGGLMDRYARGVTSRPRLALAVVLIVSAVLAASSTLVADQVGNEAFLPDDSDVSNALVTLDETFPDSAGLSAVTIIHRGDVLTPDGLAHIDAVLLAVTEDPDVAERLALTDPWPPSRPVSGRTADRGSVDRDPRGDRRRHRQPVRGPRAQPGARRARRGGRR